MAVQGPQFDFVRKALAQFPKTRLLYVSASQCAALIGPVVLNITQAEPDDDVVRATTDWVNQMRSAYPAGGGFVVVIQASAPPPGDVAKTRIDRIYQEYERSAVAAGVVVEGAGFKAAAIRAAMNLFSFGWRYKFTTKICATVQEGSTFVCDKLPPASAQRAHEVVAVYSAMRRAFEASLAEAASLSS